MTEPTADEAAAAALALENTGIPKPPAAASNEAPKQTPEQIAAAKALADKAALDEGPGAASPEAAKLAKEKADKEAADLALVEGNKDWQDNYIAFEDPAANAVVDILKEKGVSVIEANAIFAKSIKSGDLKDIDWATLEKKLGASAMVLAKAGIEQYAAGTLAQAKATTDAVYTQLGGEANWVVIRDWAQAKEKADPAFKTKLDNYRGMINLGGEASATAVEKLKGLYDADPNTKGLGVAKVEHGSAPVGVSGEPMTRKEYWAATQKARADGAQAHVFKALDARRMAGVAARI